MILSVSTSSLSNLILSTANLMMRKHSSCTITSSMYSVISPRVVFSSLPFTLLANSGSSSFCRYVVTIGVLIFLDALMISLILGTPNVMFILATPAKWKVLRVI